MTDVVLMKTASGALVAAEQESSELLARLKLGQGVRAKVARVRNLAFHKKAFSLFKLAFDAWEAPEQTYKGQPVQKDFDRFRRDLLILAGFFRAVHNVKGEVRLEAESLAFGSMTEDRFAQVYAAVLDVVWKRVMAHVGYKSPAEVDAVVNRLLAYE